MSIRNIIAKLNFHHLSIFRRDGQFVVVDHDAGGIEYHEVIGLIVARVEVDFNSRSLIDRGVAVFSSYRSTKGHRAWFVAMTAEQAAKIRTLQRGVKIDLVKAEE
jgi:hypothetical protein